MIVHVSVENRTARIAAAYHYFYNPTKEIRSFRAFQKAVRYYIEHFGLICLDDHELEFVMQEDRAIEIVAKYYH